MYACGETDPFGNLFCKTCHISDFNSFDEYHLHHLCHIRSPAVILVKLSATVYHKICESGCYQLRSGIARKSSSSVSPLKISFSKKGKKKVFKVVHSRNEPAVFVSIKLGTGESKDRRVSLEEHVEVTPKEKRRQPKVDVEGNKLLERFGAGAGISIQRKGNKNGNGEPAIKKEVADEMEVEKPVEGKSNDKEKLLERLSGIGGISIGKKGVKEDPEDVKPPGLSIASKSAKTFDLAQYNKLMKEKGAEAKPPVKNSDALLARLSGISGISFVPKGAVKQEKEAETEKKQEGTAKTAKGNESESGESGEEGSEEEESESEEEGKGEKPTPVITDVKCAVRVSNNLFAVKKEEVVDEKKPGVLAVNITESQIDTKDNLPEESGINILERLTDKLSEVPQQQDKTIDQSAPVEDTEDKSDGEDIIMEGEVMTNTVSSTTNSQMTPSTTVPSPTPSEQLHPDFIAPSEDTLIPAMNGQVYQPQPIGVNNVTALNAQPMTNYDNDVSCLDPPQNVVPFQPSLQEQPQVVQQPNGVTYATVDGTATSMAAPTGTMANSGAYWTDVNSAQPGLEQPQPQQDPLMTADGNVSQAFLQNYLGDQTGVQHAIPQDSEYMALERLGQAHQQQQHQQQQQQQQAVQQQTFQQTLPGGSAPMDQLAQQVQRMQSTPPQINVIPQHHMQAPHAMAPQLHPGSVAQGSSNEVSRDVGPVEPVFDLMHGGLTMQQQQQLAAQQNPPFDQQLMQPPMPSLYPYFNQNFNQQGQPVQQQQPQQQVQQPQFQVPQTVGRPPMLQPRPQIQARPFQSMAAPRARFGVKRTMARMPTPRHMTPPKQRRTDEMNSPGRQTVQQSSVTARLPVGVTLTPPKKTPEANKVANALAQRGITMTSNRNQQQQQQNRSPGRAIPANLNLGPGVSITPSSANRTSGGFSSPGNRRPVINHNVERPGPCATVDLTIEDDIPPPRNRIQLGRFPCNQCGKIFTSTATLETHKATHRNANALPFKCDKCSAAYPSASTLNHHRVNFHKLGKPAPDLAIPVVDLNQGGTRDQLMRAGISNYIPLSQLQSNSNGHYGLPILHVDGSQDKAMSTLNALGAANILVLGKLKPFPNR